MADLQVKWHINVKLWDRSPGKSRSHPEDTALVCLQLFPPLCTLLLLSSTRGHNRFDTRVLMNLISLMCLCLLSPKSLLLFNGVLQSYLISPLVVSQHAASPWVCWQRRLPMTWCALQPVEGRRGGSKARCVSIICVIEQRKDLDTNTVRTDITVFFPP